MKKKFGLAGLVVLMVMLALGAAAEEGNTIIIGCDMYAPYTYKNGTGEFVGVDVDFATEAFGNGWAMRCSSGRSSGKISRAIWTAEKSTVCGAASR